MNRIRHRNKNLISFIAIVSATLFANHLFAQKLEDYLKEGLSQNLSFRQQQLLAEKSSFASKEAGGAFLPSISLNARATELYGNVINLGAFINPAYAALNQVTSSNAFPTDLDIRLPLQRETTVQIRQPIFQPKVLFNYQIKERLRESAEADTEAKARDLILSIKIAYYSYAKSNQLINLYQKTLPLLEENLRVSQSLVKNEKVTADAEYRALAELADFRQKKAEAERLNTSAKEYFNFLLNRELHATILINSDESLELQEVDTAFAALDYAIQLSSKREEFTVISKGIQASEKVESIYRSDFLPTLSLGIDYGFQGNRYDFNFNQDFATISLVMQWNIFNGFQDQAKTEQAVIETNRLRLKEAELKRQIELQVRTLFEEVQLAQSLISVSDARKKASDASFQILAKKYAQGQASLVEYLDSQTSMTNAAINAIITRYDAVIKDAELERATASFPLTLFLKK
ncbi:MAG: TolC family protein [Chloroherpetonaceae bacterium]|nr:TolC family protein [Chloroherpetonaceae bacterium]